MMVRVGFARVKMQCRLPQLHCAVGRRVAIEKAQLKAELLLIPFSRLPDVSYGKRRKDRNAIDVWFSSHGSPSLLLSVVIQRLDVAVIDLISAWQRLNFDGATRFIY